MNTRLLIPAKSLTRPIISFTPVRASALQSANTHPPSLIRNPSNISPIGHEALRSPNRPLDPARHAFFESSFGHDLSRMRIHAETHATQGGTDLRARTFTLSRDTLVREGKEDLGKTIVEGYGAEEKKKQPTEESKTKGNPPSQDRASLIGLTSNQDTMAPDRSKVANVDLFRSCSQPLSWAVLQRLPKDNGARISGPPVAKNLADISAGGGAGAAGYTDWPTGYKAPDFEFNTVEEAGVGQGAGAPYEPWISRPTLKTTAFEGTCGSFYTAAGKYNTGTKEGGKDVYWNFSPAISALVKTGEQEHCDDHAEAYKISLKEAETVIKTNLVGKSFGPKASKADAESLVLAEITSKLTHAGLGNDKTKWAAMYNTLFTKTLTRDSSTWHTMSTGARSVDASGNVVYEIVAGSSQIGTHASNTIIKY